MFIYYHLSFFFAHSHSHSLCSLCFHRISFFSFFLLPYILTMTIKGGCKINNFEVMYKTDRLHNWTPLTMSDQRTIVLNDLLPGHKYQIRVTAYNEAGSTEAEYHFITPMSSLQSNNYNNNKLFGFAILLSIHFFLFHVHR